MAKQFVSDLVANARVGSTFVVKSKSLVPFKKKPERFLSCVLRDRTGEIKAVMWDNAEEVAARFEEGDVVDVAGQVNEYQGQTQIVLAEIERSPEGTYDPGELMVRSDRTEAELLQWLDGLVAQVREPHLRALLDGFFGDPDLRRKLVDAHGARSLHHAYVGGLLEHMLSVVQLLLAAAEIHPEMDRDLLIAGGLLHDMGKLEELEGTISSHYTDLGRFVGHTVLTDRIVTARIAGIEGFSPELENLLTHMLLSHHGEREWGAPVEPRTMEACALHYADNMDARIQGYKSIIRQGQASDSNWSEYHRSYQREIYIGPRPDGAEEPPPAGRLAL
jgi:3'-5' exoribonuclease